MIGLIIKSVLFGVALAMDAFSVSVARGLAEPHMSGPRAGLTAGVFGAFQTGMPLIGYGLVRAASEAFSQVQAMVPWAALFLLSLIGIHMISEGIGAESAPARPEGAAGADHAAGPETAAPRGECGSAAVGLPAFAGFHLLLVQGVATSIDALSVGLDTAALSVPAAFAESLIIGIVTFAICICGLVAGRKIGERVGRRAPILGGAILIAIGLKIFFGSL